MVSLEIPVLVATMGYGRNYNNLKIQFSEKQDRDRQFFLELLCVKVIKLECKTYHTNTCVCLHEYCLQKSEKEVESSQTENYQY